MPADRASQPIAADFYCGAGGMTKGLQMAGFYVVGFDIKPQPRYCGDEFIQMDALEAIAQFGKDFDALFASPPCQGYSRLRHLPWLKDKIYPMLIEPTRRALLETGRPYVIENVEGAPLLNGVILCGVTLGLRVYRHRKFESNVLLLSPSHSKHEIVIGHGRMGNDRRKGSLNNSSAKGAWGQQQIVTVAGNQCSKADAERALRIDWMTKYELTQAIPPAYGRYIGAQIMDALLNARAA